MTCVAVMSMGKMGDAIARTLIGGGAEVLTCLDGRGPATRARATAAGVGVTDPATIAARADIFLSVVPPARARDMAQSFLPLFAAQDRPPVYVDCNAISPETSRGIGALLGDAGLPYADGAIIGMPNATGKLPRLYIAGTGPDLAARLAGHGLDCRYLSEAPGEASELKMTYAGLTKGFQALGVTIALAADRPALRARLVAELEDSQPALYDWLQGRLPVMYEKAYRWEGEMEEIAAFLEERGLDPRQFAAAARLYAQLAEDPEKIAIVDRFVRGS